MLKLAGTRDGERFIILGIDKSNVERLQQGKPILVRGSEVGINADVTIMYGETLRDIYAELKSLGLKMPDVPKIGRGHGGEL